MKVIPAFKQGDRIIKIDKSAESTGGSIELVDWYDEETPTYSIHWDGFPITVGYSPDQIDPFYEIDDAYDGLMRFLNGHA